MKQILVVLPNWYGETLFVTPLLRILRRQRPEAHIATLGVPACREVLLHNPHVDELIDFEEQGTYRGLLGRWRLIQALRTHQFDTAFILRPSLSRTLLLALAGIPARVGFAHAKSGWLLTTRVPRSPMPRHKAFSYLPLLEAAGLASTRTAYEYTVAPQERDAARAFLASRGWPIVVLHPGANWPHKRWPVERFAALGDQLADIHQARILITGGPEAVELAAAVQRAMRQPAQVVAGETTFRQLGAVLEQVALVVSNDTGVLHLAAALQRPLVALYGPTSPVLTGPLGDPQRMIVLHHSDCCPRIPCYAPDDPAHPGMSAISVGEAYDAARELLTREAVAPS